MGLNSTLPWRFSDKSKKLITSHERLSNLISNGFHFEACAVQGTIIEALLFFSILGATGEKTTEESSKIRYKLSSLTLGGLILRARKYSLLDPLIINQIDNFKKKRNFFVHHHLVELHDFDYESTLSEGNTLITSLLEHVREKVHSQMKAIGHKDADKFKD